MTTAAEQLEQTAKHLDQAHHGQALHREIGFKAFGFHARTANTDELGTRMALLDGLHQAGTEDVTGRLTGDQCDANRSAHRYQRVMPRVEA